jgi:hypothetical protein
MRKLVLSAACIPLLLMSCNESSKGNWKKEDKEKARKDIMEGLNSGDTSNVFSMKAKNKLCDCAVEKLENRYENFAQANNDKVGLSTVISPCMELLFEDMVK